MTDKDCRAPIILLLEGRRPPNITRKITSVIIDPLYRVKRRRARADVVQKGIEADLPATADLDSATAVMTIILTSRIQASILDMLPGPIFRSI